MTRSECAAALYDLIVVRGRWNNSPPVSVLFPENDYDHLPSWMKDVWEDKADQFREENSFYFTD